MKKLVNIMFAGIGGQGIILASDMLTEVAFRMGFDVKKSELHGMSQRGGSVSADVRFGEKVHSPMIPCGAVDFLIAVSEDQIPVWEHMLSPETVLIKPSDLSSEDATSKMLNISLLGVLNKYLRFPPDFWETLIDETFPPDLAAKNKDAFSRGMQLEL